jgi:hypothetical protein
VATLLEKMGFHGALSGAHGVYVPQTVLYRHRGIVERVNNE